MAALDVVVFDLSGDRRPCGSQSGAARRIPL